MNNLNSPPENHLVVIRISDSGAIKELTKKVLETAAMHPTLPGAKELAKLGSSPFQDPEKVGGQAFTCPGFKAVYFRLPGTKTHVLMALGSATKINLGEDDNAFVKLLADILAGTEVESLWVADFTRLLRSVDYLSETWKAVRTRCRYVRHAGAVIDTQGPTAEIQFLFEALSAAADARSTVKRTTVGKMRSYVDGKCPLAASTVPLGYIRNSDRELELAQPIPTGVVRTIIQVLGDPGLSDPERVERVAAAGGTSPARTRQACRPVSINELSNPSEAVSRWYRQLEVWRSGEWVVDYRLPTLLNQTSIELPVVITESLGMRVWRMTFSLPLPEGGWATSDELDAAVIVRDRRAAHSSPTGGAAPGSVRKPFCGLPAWRHGDDQYVLVSHSKGRYALRRRPIADAQEKKFIDGSWRWVERGWGRSRKREGVLVGNIDAPSLHAAVVEGLVEAATSGLTLQAASEAVFESDDELVDDLRERLAARRRAADNARRNANEAQSETQRREFLQDAEAARAEATELEQDVLRLAGANAHDRVRVDADAVAVALARVADQADHVPGTVADSLRTVLNNFKLIPVDETTVQWQACLRIPLAGGALTLGPATGQLEVGSSRQLAERRSRTLPSRAIEAAENFMADGLDLPETVKRLQTTNHRRVAQLLRDYLKNLGLSASAASVLVADSPPPARRVVWERTNGRPFPSDLPPAYASHVARAYLTDTVSTGSNPARAEQQLSGLLAAVEHQGGWVPEAELDTVAHAAGISRATLNQYIKGFERYGRVNPSVLRRRDGGVGLVACPHTSCDGWATLVAILPEVPSHLLCTKCMRMPDLKYAGLVFGEAYRDRRGDG